MRKIPNYDLYGESARPPWYEAFYFERIAERAGANRWEISAHRHDALLQILYILGGSGEVLIENAWLPIKPPCVVLVPAQTVHGFVFLPDIEGPVITAAQRPLESMLGIVAPDALSVLQHPAVIPVAWAPDERDSLIPLFDLVETEFRAGSTERVTAGMSLLTALLIHVSRLSQRAAKPPSGPNNRRTACLNKFRDLINANFRHHDSIDRYAQKLGMTVAQLGRICRDELATSPMSIVNARIVREAQRELAYSDMSIKQIAHGLGFPDTAYFSRYFRKQTGVTPTEFRSGTHTARRETLLAQGASDAGAPPPA